MPRHLPRQHVTRKPLPRQPLLILSKITPRTHEAHEAQKQQFHAQNKERGTRVSEVWTLPCASAEGDDAWGYHRGGHVSKT